MEINPLLLLQWKLLGKKTGYGDEWVKIGGLKLVCDGSISERTARLSEPYIGRPDYYGIIINNEDEIFEQAIKAHLNDWQIGVHANGDVGIDITLKVFERLQKEPTSIRSRTPLPSKSSSCVPTSFFHFFSIII